MQFKKTLSLLMAIVILFSIFNASFAHVITSRSTSIDSSKNDAAINCYSGVIVNSANINIGDYMYLGTYLGERILWRCVDIDENGPLMLSDKVLCLKCYDAKGESDLHADGWGYIRRGAGSNCWYDSNLRQWLNSNETEVSWSHCPPYSSSTQFGTNGYADESGFLCGFTTNELALVASTTQKIYINEWELHRPGYCDGGSFEVFPGSPYYFTNLTNSFYEGGYYQNVTDWFFVPGTNHLINIYRNLGDYIYAKPTIKATEQFVSSFATFNISSNYPYWSSTAVNEGASYENESIMWNDQYMYSSARAYNGEVGVRPAFYLADGVYLVGGNGSISAPFFTSLGDANSDGFVNANDALAVLRYSLGLMNSINLFAADINGDGFVNANDALMILRAALGLVAL